MPSASQSKKPYSRFMFLRSSTMDPLLSYFTRFIIFKGKIKTKETLNYKSNLKIFIVQILIKFIQILRFNLNGQIVMYHQYQS